MLKNKESYLCLSAMLRAREPKLLNGEKASRMLDAATFEEAAKLLTDCGYDDMSQMRTSEIEQALSEHRKEIFDELERLTPDPVIPDLFRMKYDYHNAKVILKAEAMQTQSDHLLSDSGRISPIQLRSLYHEEKYSSMPGTLGKAMEEAAEVLARTSNPQQADFVLDKAYYTEFLSAAEKSGNSFLLGYGKLGGCELRRIANLEVLGIEGCLVKDRLGGEPVEVGIAALLLGGIAEDAEARAHEDAEVEALRGLLA